MNDRPRGRPPLAPVVSQLPATTVPVQVHDAVIRESVSRGVSVARVVRDAVISHLLIRQREEIRQNRP